MIGMFWLYFFLFIIIAIVFNLPRIFESIFGDHSEEMVAEKDSVMICPNCGSTNTNADLSKDMISQRGSSTRYLCDDCDFSAPGFPIVPKEKVKKIRKQIQNKDQASKEWLKTISMTKGVNLKLTYNRFIEYLEEDKKPKKKARQKK